MQVYDSKTARFEVRDGLEMMRSLQPDCCAAVFFDPQYRALNKKMAYGDERTGRMQRVHKLPAMSEETISNMLLEAERIVRPWGHVFMWIDKFMLVSGVRLYLQLSRLQPVDMITWNKVRVGMGYRSRRASEYLVVLQKPKDGETRAKNIWKDRGIKDVWEESALRGNHIHPHEKPMRLTQRLIECVSEPGDLIVDPCAGSGSTGQAAANCGRCAYMADLIDRANYMP